MSDISAMHAEDVERSALTPGDYSDAGVEPPNWRDDPVPTLETWRTWKAAQDKALAFKRAKTLANKRY